MTEIVHTKIGIITYLAPTGPLTEPGAAEALQATIDTCLATKDINLVLDLSNVPTLTGMLIELFLDIQGNLARFGGSLKVVNANSLVRDIFLITSFNDYVAVLDKI